VKLRTQRKRTVQTTPALALDRQHTKTSGNGIDTRSYHGSLRALDLPLEERLQSRAFLVLNKYTSVNKTSVCLSPTRPWPQQPRPQQPPSRQQRAQLIQHQCSPPSHSAALSTRTNQDSYAFHRDIRRFFPGRSSATQVHWIANSTHVNRSDNLQHRSLGHTCRQSGSDFY
jgi:hypothetical protein